MPEKKDDDLQPRLQAMKCEQGITINEVRIKNYNQPSEMYNIYSSEKLLSGNKDVRSMNNYQIVLPTTVKWKLLQEAHFKDISLTSRLFHYRIKEYLQIISA